MDGANMITYTFPTSKNPTLSQVINALSFYVMSYSSPINSNSTINGSIGLSMQNGIVQNIQIIFFENANEYSYTDPNTKYTVSAQPLSSIPSQSEIENLLSQAGLI
ncbi:MAG: hypothetical protein QW478_11785 [Candidatus Micrarchaeaceae archaeon]